MTTGAVATRPLVDVRADFPVLRRKFNGKRLVYLDSGASAQKPRQVIETMERFYSHSYGTVHRGVYAVGHVALTDRGSGFEVTSSYGVVVLPREARALGPAEPDQAGQRPMGYDPSACSLPGRLSSS